MHMRCETSVTLDSIAYGRIGSQRAHTYTVSNLCYGVISIS